MDFALHSGRKIAKDYYGCRGAFIQLSTYPILAEDDTLGAVPMGRMAYMTGWAMSHCWWRYRYTLDKEWLRSTGYPAIRDCALFYTRFAARSGPTGCITFSPPTRARTVSPATRRITPIARRSCSRCGIACEMAFWPAKRWTSTRICVPRGGTGFEHAAGDDGRPPLVLSGLEKERYEANPPEFGLATPVNNYRPEAGKATVARIRLVFRPVSDLTMLGVLHRGEFVVERDFPIFRRLARGMAAPNGAVLGDDRGRLRPGRRVDREPRGCRSVAGDDVAKLGWPASLSVLAGEGRCALRRLPRRRGLSVSAAWSRGNVAALSIRSLRGAPCRVYSPWPKGFSVVDASGRENRRGERCLRPPRVRHAGGRFLSPNFTIGGDGRSPIPEW